MMEPARTSGEATTCGMDAETERLLNDIFMAYSLPCGVLKGKDGTRPGPQSKLAKAASVPVGAMEVVDAMDDIGWQQLCSDCKLDDDSCLPAARPLFKQVAKGDTLEFTGFVEVLKAIARVRYGEDGAMTRLVYFKVISYNFPYNFPITINFPITHMLLPSIKTDEMCMHTCVHVAAHSFCAGFVASEKPTEHPKGGQPTKHSASERED